MKAIYMFSLAAMVAGLAIPGCGAGSQAVGKWTFKSFDLPGAEPERKKGLLRFFSIMTLDIKADSTYELAAAGAKTPATGTWVMTEHKITLSPDPPPGSSTGKPTGDPITVTLSEDGKSLVMGAPGGGAGGITFAKSGN